MYKTVFQNSKVALLFAGMTLLSAVSMVGTEDNQGVVPEAAERIEAQRSAVTSNAQSVVASEAGAPQAQKPVFGNWSDSPASTDSAGSIDPAVPEEDQSDTVIELDSDGVTVPREP